MLKIAGNKGGGNGTGLHYYLGKEHTLLKRYSQEKEMIRHQVPKSEAGLGVPPDACQRSEGQPKSIKKTIRIIRK